MISTPALQKAFRVLNYIFRLSFEKGFVKQTQRLVISVCRPLHAVNTDVKMCTTRLAPH